MHWEIQHIELMRFLEIGNEAGSAQCDCPGDDQDGLLVSQAVPTGKAIGRLRAAYSQGPLPWIYFV